MGDVIGYAVVCEQADSQGALTLELDLRNYRLMTGPAEAEKEAVREQGHADLDADLTAPYFQRFFAVEVRRVEPAA